MHTMYLPRRALKEIIVGEFKFKKIHRKEIQFTTAAVCIEHTPYIVTVT